MSYKIHAKIGTHPRTILLVGFKRKLPVEGECIKAKDTLGREPWEIRVLPWSRFIVERIDDGFYFVRRA